MTRYFLAALTICASTLGLANEGGPVIRFDYKPGEILQLTDAYIAKFDVAINQILSIANRDKNFKNTIAAFDEASIAFDDEVTQLAFMKDVSTNKDMRAEATKCEEKVSDYMVGVYTRRDIYDALVLADKQTPKNTMSKVDLRLAEQTIKSFKRNGLFLPDKELAEVKKLQQEVSKLTIQFQANINEDKSFMLFTATELEGVPQSFLDRLEKVDGKYKVTAKASDYVVLMDNAKSSETRRKMASVYENRAADKNIELLKKILALRIQIAEKLKYKTWADYKTEDRMAKNAKTAADFLQGLKTKLAGRNQKDLDILLKYKKMEDPKTKELAPWDGRYLEYQMKKKYFTLDDEMIREYFPADATVQKMFEIYSKLFGVKFVEVKNAPVWAPDVKLYEIRNAKDGSFVANFFTDFYPREGKYSHAAAFGLVTGRDVDGKYLPPVAAIVSNFEPPANGKPSLLDHDQVETLFHEFGHIMHQTLTRAKYGSLAGTRVARDFVEAPSQMLENWVWDAKTLKEVSGHYKDPTKKLPDQIIQKILEARDFNKGYFYTRQLLYGIFDMTLHTSKKPVADPSGLYKKLYKELTHIKPMDDTNFPASFGHLMGYDAGYYGYLWSEVFADDMFTLFQKDGLLSSKVGGKYRATILEKGDTEEAGDLLAEFLGRKPNNKAFFKRLAGSKGFEFPKSN